MTRSMSVQRPIFNSTRFNLSTSVELHHSLHWFLNWISWPGTMTKRLRSLEVSFDAGRGTGKRACDSVTDKWSLS